MPVLSLWQPWASAIALGVKRFETRSWPPPDWLNGVRIAIHAARTQKGLYLVGEPRWRDLEAAGGGRTSGPIESRTPTHNPLGAIVCTAVVTGYHRSEVLAHLLDERERRWGDYAPGRFVWYLVDVRPVLPPVSFRGGQGLSKRWTP